MFFQTSLGIQIERSVVSVALARSSVKGPRITASEVVSIDPDMVVKERVRNVGELVSQFLRRYRVSPGSIVLGLPRETVILRNITLPLAVKENLRASLTYEMEKYVPFAADDVYFDFQIIREDKKENRIDLLLAVAKRDMVRPYFELRDLIGRGITGIGIGCAGTVNVLLKMDRDLEDEFFRLIYFGKDSFEVAVVTAGMMAYSRAYEIPDGLQNLPEEVIKGLEQTQQTAGLEIKSTDVVICGSGKNDTIAEKLKERGLTVRDVDPSMRVLPSQGLIPAFGLSLGGIEKAPNQLNFLPRELQKRPSKVPYYLLVILLIAAIFGGAAWRGSGIFQRRLFYNNLQSEVVRLRTEVAKTEEIRQKCDRIQKELDDLVRGTSVNTSVLEILREITIRIPEDTWVSTFYLSKGSVTIAGYADTASTLIPLLEASPVLQDVIFLSTITKTKQGKERFRIGFKAG